MQKRIDWQNDLRRKIEEIRAADEPYRGIPYTGRRSRSPTPEPDGEVTLPVGLDDSPPDLDDALSDDANVASGIEYAYPCYSPTSPDAHDDEEDGAGAAEVAVEETPTDADKYETGIYDPGRPDQSEDIEDGKLTTKPADESSDDDSNPEEAPRRKKARTD
ncbi:hypothetical protein CYMTET_13906 [Cymbomonas tetramitiformis]|uniref:Uncharacterized protein n=1 Tax=Cymbomonas tetramitiformis TaxID=36881 RepID=A0AAE0LAE7_9CHLO|nr:hypothetical protein CYMTET_13906 [Cymbomonas tetramitiformis]